MPKLSAAELGLPDAVDCPFCEGRDTELHSAFGSQLSVATYWCRRCATAFEYFKEAPPVAAPGEVDSAARPGARPAKSSGPPH